jgi:hypothetical protein
MGNQMFIYACARSLARHRNLSYCLSDLQALQPWFELHPEDHKNKLKYNIFRLQNTFPWSRYKFEHMQDNRIDYSAKMLREKSPRIWYYGYFQGRKYLFENESDIKTAFRLKEKPRSDFEAARKKLGLDHDFIAVHIRLRDYRTFGPDFLDGPDLTLPFGYYREALREQISAHPGLKVIFLSDEMATVKKEFSDFPQALFSDQSPIIDFQILNAASVSIISHSSFAWWAAFLNENVKKKVIVPRYFLGFKVRKEFPVNMILPEWEARDVTFA